jgi:hypothetical protein
MAQPVRVEVYLVESCDDVTLGARPVPALASTYVSRDQAGALGEVDPGDYGLYGVAQDVTCEVVAAGCAPVAITDANDALEVTLSSMQTGGCPVGVTCSVNMDTGDCIENTGGTGGSGGGAGMGGFGGAGGMSGAGGAGGDPVTRVADGLIVLYDFEEGSGDTVSDQSGVTPVLDLSIADPGNVSWGAGYLSVDAGTTISSAGAATKVFDRVTPTDEITVEAWVKPASLVPVGLAPDRIISMSADELARNFLLGQDATTYAARYRTPGQNNGSPTITTTSDSAEVRLQHVVYTHAADGSEVIYIDGVANTTTTRTGDTSTWDASYPLVVANEVNGAREWLGELHLIAIYDRALGDLEVQQNLDAGP